MTTAVDAAVPTRVLIVDDAASTRRFLRGVFEYSPQFEVAGEAENGASAIEMADVLQPDVVLLDLSMPVSDGSSALSGLLRVAPNARVVVLSSTDKTGAAPLLAAGATGFVQKGLAPFDLLDRLGGILQQPVTLQRSVPAQKGPPAAVAQAASGQLRAVVCDDNTMTRRLIERILTSCDVPVLAETDGVPHLLSVVRLAQPEIVVLDLWLEGTTGTTAIPEIRKISPGTIVIVYSAYEEWREKALAAGAALFVVKPNFGELEAEVRRLSTRSIPT